MDEAPSLARKHPVHLPPLEADNRSIIIFLTVCTKGRRPLLASAEVQHLLVDVWSRASRWLVGRYVIMPDHIHLFCAPGAPPAHPLGAWVRYWQNLATRNWLKPEEKPIWQKDFWDRQLRSGDSYNRKWDYVINNPVRHKHCVRAGDGRIRVNSTCCPGIDREGLAELGPPQNTTGAAEFRPGPAHSASIRSL